MKSNVQENTIMFIHYESEYCFDDYAEKQMVEYANEALTIVAHSTNNKNALHYAKILSYGFFDDVPSANTLAKELGLSWIHFYALTENYKDFKRYLEQEVLEHYYSRGN